MAVKHTSFSAKVVQFFLTIILKSFPSYSHLGFWTISKISEDELFSAKSKGHWSNVLSIFLYRPFKKTDHFDCNFFWFTFSEQIHFNQAISVLWRILIVSPLWFYKKNVKIFFLQNKSSNSKIISYKTKMEITQIRKYLGKFRLTKNTINSFWKW